MKNINLNDFPKYSPWPERLLNVNKWTTHYKNPREIKREYDKEKWGGVYNRLATESLKLADLETEGANINMLGYTNKDGFLLAEANWWQRRKLDLYEKTIRFALNDGESLLELGSGYGSIIIPLAERMQRVFKYFGGAEYTDSGLSAMRLLIERQGLNIQTGKCDFFELTCDESIESMPFPIIFTSFALMYIPLLSDSFIDWLLAMKPDKVIHFEPIYEFQKDKTLWGCMCRRYIEVNDYNRNLWPLLIEAEKCGKIKIMSVNENVYGSNAFLPISVIVWKPII